MVLDEASGRPAAPRCGAGEGPAAAPRFLLRAGDRTLLLHHGECLRIGRHPTNDLVLRHPTVSRFHARLSWPATAQRPAVTDLGSANGTLIDGVQVRTAPLPDLGVLGVGDVEVRVELEDPALVADDGRLTCRLVGDWLRADEQGVLDATSLGALLLELERRRRTGTLALTLPGGEEARLTLASGRIADARVAGRSGHDAVAEVLERFERGRFTFRADVEPHECCLCLSPRSILASSKTHAEGTDPPRTEPVPRPPRTP